MVYFTTLIFAQVANSDGKLGGAWERGYCMLGCMMQLGLGQWGTKYFPSKVYLQFISTVVRLVWYCLHVLDFAHITGVHPSEM